MHDRRGWMHPLPVIEVMKVNETNLDRSQAEIPRMLDVASGGNDAIRRLDGCVASLVQTHASKVALTAAPKLICMPHALRRAYASNQAP
jgi:hypothetical protein